MQASQWTSNYGGGGAMMALPPPTTTQQSTNAQLPTNNNGRMRWRTTAAEETRWMKQRTRNCSWWWRGNNGADNNNKNTRINKCVVAEAEDNNGWQEAGHGSGEGGATLVWQWRRNSFAIRSWRMEVEDGQGSSFFFS
jgi:hypothetical protein